MISYAQNFEDVMLWRALGVVTDGFYIDTGAHDPVSGSVTKAFYDQGWRGINIEPMATPFELLKSARPRDINLQICAGSYNGTIDIYDILPSGLATTKSSIAKEYKTKGHPVEVKRIAVRTLSAICEEYAKSDIHFLKIDVEGSEKEVLIGADFNMFRPWIIVVEATHPHSSKLTCFEWEEIVLSAGYIFAYFDGLNRFYVSNEHNELLSHFVTPPNFFDGFALSSTCFFSRQVTAELHQSEAKARAAITRAEDLSHELQTVYNSTSWRITRPLRQTKQFLLVLLRLSVQAVVAIRRGATRTAKSLLCPVAARAISFVLKRPRLRIAVMARLRKRPLLLERLRGFAAARGLIARVQPAFIHVERPSLIVNDRIRHNERTKVIAMRVDEIMRALQPGIKR